MHVGSIPAPTSHDADYAALENAVYANIAKTPGPLFETDVDVIGLWNDFLSSLPEDPQHYNCRACRKFIFNYGGLVEVGINGDTHPLIWDITSPLFFASSVNRMYRRVAAARITGVFVWDINNNVWGTPRTGEWTHLHGIPTYTPKYYQLTAKSAMALKKEEFEMLVRGLEEYDVSVAERTLNVLNSDTLYRSEKGLNFIRWFVDLHKTVDGENWTRKQNLIWKAVATAPAGFCHIKTHVVHTLMDDIKAGLPHSAYAARWAARLHPTRYMRPTAQPSAGNIRRAEKLFTEFNLERALERRFATLDDVQSFLWRPREQRSKPGTTTSGIFSHLAQQPPSFPDTDDKPVISITWHKFAKKVLPEALSIEINLGYNGPFYGLLTAVHPDAPPLLQWDGQPRNPVSWYYYIPTSRASDWNLTPYSWAKVNAVFLDPAHWHSPEKFTHKAEQVMFALDGCYDTRADSMSLCIFPENIRAELHEVRKTIEAYSRSAVGRVAGAKEGNANGIAFSATNNNRLTALRLRVKTEGGTNTYLLDRWD